MKPRIRLFRSALMAVAIGCLSACSLLSVQAPEAPRVLMVVPQSQIADVEYSVPRAALEEAGAHITVASLSTEEATGKVLRLKPDLAIDAAQAGDYDAIAVIGGWGTMYQLWDHPGLRQLLREADRENKLIAAICAAPVVLARAGLLKGRDATGSPDVKKGDQVMRKELVALGANYRDDQLVVVDGRLITGNGPQSSQAFAATLVQALSAPRP